MNKATLDDFDEVWEYFHANKEWFPHVRKFHIRNRLDWGQVILKDGVLITQQQYKRTGRIGKNSTVVTQKGDYIIHQIIAKWMVIKHAIWHRRADTLSTCRGGVNQNIKV